MAETTTITLTDVATFMQKALQWANYFPTVCLLDSNNYPQLSYSTKDWELAVDAIRQISTAENSLKQLKQFHTESRSTIFGYLTYDLKNELEDLQSIHQDRLGFPALHFFEPRYVLSIHGDKLTVNRNYPETVELVEMINKIDLNQNHSHSSIKLTLRTDKSTYLKNVASIREQIIAGDFYELNYCNEFFAEGVSLSPTTVFNSLNNKASAPFSCFYKLEDKYLLCASPERFLAKNGTKIIAQPIKGTVKKGQTEEENTDLIEQLQNDEKERAENVMIVDLVRNDLAKTAKPGSVKVEELFGIYTFNTVHQMISTVVSEVNSDVHPIDILKAAFPMGSMTGAPKVMVMQTIEQYENFKRGLYSGTVGYITPDGDFDFNVVIRSVLYNSKNKYISVPVGGAITFDSIAEKEWEEILLKADLARTVLSIDYQ
jgi:para-aminobenzoate synthetase component 1